MNQNETVFKYGDEGDLFYIIIKGTVGVKVPIPTNYFMTRQQFAEFYIENHTEIILDKTTHFINTDDMKENESFLNFIKDKESKGVFEEGNFIILTIFLFKRF